jgi:L,D-peptidoglycan transpeptidase YkuD (ErfK/YbiS/YcfS/YnhG family)
MLFLITLVCSFSFLRGYGTRLDNLPTKNCSDLINVPRSTSQVLIVNGDHNQKSKAYITPCEWNGTIWEHARQTFPAVVGSNGISQYNQKVEGDNKTPSGFYSLGESFGWTSPASDPVVALFKTDYKFIVDVLDQDGHYWDKFVDDSESPYYNTWVSGPTDATSFEQMRINAYKYGLVINYNMYPMVSGKGSAIFLHIWSGPEGSTAGCVALDEENLLQILQWLDKSHLPMIDIVPPHCYIDGE